MKEQLPGFVIAELYSKSLVDIPEQLKPQSIQKVEKNKKKYLGNYEKKIAVLVNDETNVYLDDENLKFLTGILNACKLNLGHIALLNLINNQMNFSMLKKEMQTEFLIAFGISAMEIELPFNMPNYQVQQYDNCKILLAPALSELNGLSEKAKTEKTKLWKSLQKMFNLEK